MIDTKELRENAKSVEPDGFFGMDRKRALKIANELDRLYEFERRNTPLTLNHLQTELGKIAVMVRFPMEGPVDFKTKSGVIVSISDDGKNVSIIDAPISAVTLALLDALDVK